MNLYKIHRPNSMAIGYDECRGFVVQASDEASARNIAAAHCGDEGPDVWRFPGATPCQLLAPMPLPLLMQDAPDGVVLTDFNAG